MAYLYILKGPGQGLWVELDRDLVLGRNPDCRVLIPSTSVSRQHARILHDQGRVYIEDLNSRNGTRVNESCIKARTLLREGDRIQICDFVATFHEIYCPTELARIEKLEKYERSVETYTSVVAGERTSITCESSERVYTPVDARERATILAAFEDFLRRDLAVADPPGAKAEPRVSAPGGRKPLETTTADWSCEEECRRIREALQHNHVLELYPPAPYRRLLEELRDPRSQGRQLLTQGFHRFVLLDAERGLEAGRFNLERFFDYAVQEMVGVFDLDLGEGVVQEDIAQILKDEPRSLYCFVNVHHVPENLRTRLRSFTQEWHQALMLLELQRQHHSQPDCIPSRILDGLFINFQQTDRGFVALRDERTGALLCKATKARRSRDAGDAHFSDNLVRRCLEAGQAFFDHEDAADALEFSMRSVMCGPLVSADARPFGVVQLDAQGSEKFTSDDLLLFDALCGRAGVVLGDFCS
jgi:hypothetical protein